MEGQQCPTNFPIPIPLARHSHLGLFPTAGVDTAEMSRRVVLPSSSISSVRLLTAGDKAGRSQGQQEPPGAQGVPKGTQRSWWGQHTLLPPPYLLERTCCSSGSRAVRPLNPVGLQGHGNSPVLQEEPGEEGRLPRESPESQAVPTEPQPQNSPTQSLPRCATSSCASPAPCPRNSPEHLAR